ncbi:MAG: DMT family transporter [Burkholderiaceae bacterium]
MRLALSRSRLAIDPTCAALALTALLWSCNFVIGRAVRDDITPVTMNFLRWAIALAVLLPFTLGDIRAHRAALLGHWKLLAMLGLTGIASFQTLCYVALRTTTAVNAVLLLSARAARDRVRVVARARRAGDAPAGLGLAVSSAGAAVLVVHGDLATLMTLQFEVGDLWMLVAVGLWAAYSVLLRRRPPEVPPLAVHACSVLAGTLWMLPLFAWQSGSGVALPASAGAWAAVAFIAVFSSALAHALWVRGVAAIGPSRAGVFIHLMPLFGATLAVAFLGEALGGFHVAGAALVMCGVFLAGGR